MAIQRTEVCLNRKMAFELALAILQASESDYIVELRIETDTVSPVVAITVGDKDYLGRSVKHEKEIAK